VKKSQVFRKLKQYAHRISYWSSFALLSISVILICANPGYSDPYISSFSGNVTNGNTLTIQGSGFNNIPSYKYRDFFDNWTGSWGKMHSEYIYPPITVGTPERITWKYDNVETYSKNTNKAEINRGGNNSNYSTGYWLKQNYFWVNTVSAGMAADFKATLDGTDPELWLSWYIKYGDSVTPWPTPYRETGSGKIGYIWLSHENVNGKGNRQWIPEVSNALSGDSPFSFNWETISGYSASGTHLNFIRGKWIHWKVHIKVNTFSSWINISSISRSNNIVTVVTATPHGFHTNDFVNIRNCSKSSFNTVSTYQANGILITYVNPTTFKLPQSGLNESGSDGQVAAGFQDGRVEAWVNNTKIEDKSGCVEDYPGNNVIDALEFMANHSGSGVSGDCGQANIGDRRGCVCDWLPNNGTEPNRYFDDVVIHTSDPGYGSAFVYLSNQSIWGTGPTDILNGDANFIRQKVGGTDFADYGFKSWTDIKLKFEVSLGNLNQNLPIYLYVTNWQGQTNSKAFKLDVAAPVIPVPPPTITPTPTPTPKTTPTSSNTTGNNKGLLKNKLSALRIFFGLSYVNADGSPIGNIKSYEISAVDNGSNSTNPSNPTNPSNSNVQVLDASNTSALDSDNQIKSSSRSFWSSEVDGKQVDKGGVGEVLLTRSRQRNIVTNIEGANLMSESNEFEISNEKITPELLGLSPKDMAGKEKLIQYVHGYDSYVDVKGKSDLKKRKWMLGTIINSQPLVIPYEDSRSVIYVGANDGMLHAFDNATGEELWGFIPYELLGLLREISQNNALKYFVDGSPKVYIANSKKIIIFGLGKGGSHYYALDVTNPDSPKFLWKIGPETTGFSELGQAWSTPQIRKVKYETGERAVCFIGGGYDENQSRGVVSDKRGRAVYAIDVITGTQIWRWDHGKDGNMNFSIPSDISCVDTNGDGYIDRLYVGDTGGRLWRFDIKESGPNTWSAKVIFDTNTNIVTGSKRKIFYRPDVTLENGYEMVFFGTGDREHQDEIKVINQIYAIKDKGLDKLISMSNLENVTYGVADLKSLEGKEGWFINLEGNNGEKVLGPPVVIFGVAYLGTYTPFIGNVNGTAQLYALDYKNGNPILNLNPSNDRDGVKIDLSDRSKVIGTGIPSNTVISALDSLPVAFTGFSGGVYNTPLRKNSTIIPIWWKEVRK
jgi:hypothetical protein